MSFTILFFFLFSIFLFSILNVNTEKRKKNALMSVIRWSWIRLNSLKVIFVESSSECEKFLFFFFFFQAVNEWHWICFLSLFNACASACEYVVSIFLDSLFASERQKDQKITLTLFRWNEIKSKKKYKKFKWEIQCGRDSIYIFTMEIMNVIWCDVHFRLLSLFTLHVVRQKHKNNKWDIANW